jgi:spore coat protein U-like protein
MEVPGMVLKKTLLAAAVSAVAGLSLNASANTATGTFKVTLAIQSGCTVTTTAGSNITLGPVMAGTATTMQSGVFAVACSNGTAFTVGLAPSNNNTAGAGVLKGAIAGNNATIAYQLYQDAGGTTIWGNTAAVGNQGNGESGTGAGVATPVNFTVYANATGSTDVAQDNYSDTVTITANF